MKALSVRQPWVWAIFHAGKDVENRDWPARFRGTVAIHASGTMTRDEYFAIHRFVNQTKVIDRQRLPAFHDLVLGAIVGLADIVDCVRRSESPWFVGDYGFVLANKRLLKEPIPCKGARSLWDVPAEIVARIEEQLR